MRPTLLRRMLLVCALTAAVAAPAANAESPLARRLDAALKASGLAGPGTGAYVVDLRTGRAVYAKNASRSLVPASNEKLAVTFAALALLGPGYRLRTEVAGTGELVGKVWHGNLVLRGFGDPTLNRWSLRSLAAQVRKAGIRHVTGRLVADSTAYDALRVGPGWKPSFYLDECAPLSALFFDGPKESTEPWLAAAEAFRVELRRKKITVAGTTRAARAEGVPLAVHWSRPLAEILRELNVESDNFLAEMVLKELGRVVVGRGSTRAGARVVRSVLEAHGIPMRGVVIADGSGLSSLDRLTARSIVAMLRDEQLRPVLRTLLPRAGIDGTLERRMRTRPARGAVRAKTGTLEHVSALSGYVRNRFAFAVIQNGAKLSSAKARASQDRFAAILAARV